MDIINIDGRLKTISEMIRGSVVADIGCDHAYLTIWLRQTNKIKKAYAIDISPNVIAKIKRTLKKYNIPEEIITPVLSDGLSENINGFYNMSDIDEINEISDIIISGLGGGTIADILGKLNKNIEKKNINFILQPNNKDEVLREFLYSNGFYIEKETVVEVDGWIYDIIQAEFTGEIYTPNPMDIIIGKNITHAEYINNIITRLQRILKDLDNLDKKDKKGGEKYTVKTAFGFYADIENLISEIKNYERNNGF